LELRGATKPFNLGVWATPRSPNEPAGADCNGDIETRPRKPAAQLLITWAGGVCSGVCSGGGCQAPRARVTLAPVKVFLSYAERDEKFARSIRAELEKGSFVVWDASAKITPGENWALELGKALREADAMVVLLSPAALASDHVKREIEYALGEPRFKGRLLPVVVRAVKEVPWILETLNVVRIESDPERGGRRVLEALKRIKHAA
jgi:hypothetical protein